MLNAPDVLEIIDDPEIGGGVPFQVRRIRNVRVRGNVSQQPELFSLTGNIQPEWKNSQTSTSEDTLMEGIVVYAAFEFQNGDNRYTEFIGPDEILYRGDVWRVTRVDNWADWGFSIAHATKVMG